MSNAILLDCTLRDGGYVNNWDFGKREISKITKHLVSAGIEIIELGFLTDIVHSENQSLFSSAKEIDALVSEKRSSLLAAMIALGEKEMDPNSLPDSSECNLDIVRITFHGNDKEITRAVEFAECLMAKGYKICMQPIGTAFYSDKELVSLIERMNELNPYAVYIVDTLGSFYNEDLLRLIYIVDHNLSADIKLGFHSHNNLQMAFSNAQKILELHSKREFILDSSLFGMGRGAGNLCTELISRYMNNIGMSNYNTVQIVEAIENYIYPIKCKHEWGYNAHYYMAAVHKCHPNYASYLMNKQTLTMNQVNLLLQNLPHDKRHIFNKALIEDLYQKMQDVSIDDGISIETLSEKMKDKSVLIVAPGKSISQYSESINSFIKEADPVIISVNTVYHGIKEDFVFISNNKRLLSLDYEKCNGGIIATSNLPKLTSNFIIVNYSNLTNNNYAEPDNAGMMLLRLLASIGVKKAYLSGFDGYSTQGKYDYYTEKIINRADAAETEIRNNSIVTQIKDISKKISVEFLTPSIYQRMIENEI